MSAPRHKVKRRQIAEADLAEVAHRLAEGFPERSLEYWRRGLARMAARPQTPGRPRFGYLLEADGVVVGVLLLIFTDFGGPGAPQIRCNVSSWYVDPAYRVYAAQLAAAALAHAPDTLVNVSPAKHTWPMLTAQGYRRYSDGQMACLPLLSRRSGRGRTKVVEVGGARPGLAEDDLLIAHAASGCLSVVCESAAGRDPFVLAPRRVAYAPVGVMQLVWCRDTLDFVRCCGALGRFLARRGVFCVILDANAPVAGLVGRYFPGRQPKYFRGAAAPRLNDLAFTETVLFGA